MALGAGADAEIPIPCCPLCWRNAALCPLLPHDALAAAPGFVPCWRMASASMCSPTCALCLLLLHVLLSLLLLLLY